MCNGKNEVEEVLRPRGFQIKYWVFSGGDDNNAKVLNSEQEKVLGLGWKPKQDNFSKLNLTSIKGQGKVEQSDVNCSEFESLMPCLLTKRSVLSQFATLYDL